MKPKDVEGTGMAAEWCEKGGRWWVIILAIYGIRDKDKRKLEVPI